MMRMKTIGSHVRTALLAALALGGWMGAVEASPITEPLYFITNGSIGDSSGPITFQGQSYGSNIIPGMINLGTFNDFTSLPSSASLAYDNTPFHIYMTVYNNGPLNPTNSSTLEIDGTLNGAITGNTQSTMALSVTSVHQTGGAALPFLLSDLTFSSPLYISPEGINGGQTPLFALVSKLSGDPTPVPEPTTLGLYVVGLGGVGAWRLRRKGLRVATA